MNFDYKSHESYGMAQFSRVSSSGQFNLFGSSITHSNTIKLSICHGSVKRDLHREWYSSDNEIVEVEISESQFAELITTMNMGSGIPCTIRRLEGKRMADPPFKNQRQLHEDEFKEDVKKIGEDLDTLASDLQKLVDGKAPIKAYREFIQRVKMVAQDVNCNLPFVQKSFNEAMDKTVIEAKGEVEAFVLNKVVSLGIEQLKMQTPQITKGEE